MSDSRAAKAETTAQLLNNLATIEAGKKLYGESLRIHSSSVEIASHRNTIRKILAQKSFSPDTAQDVDTFLRELKSYMFSDTLVSPAHILKYVDPVLVKTVGVDYATKVVNHIATRPSTQRGLTEALFYEFTTKEIKHLFYALQEASRFDEFFAFINPANTSVIPTKIRHLAIEWHKKHPVKTDVPAETIAPEVDTPLEIVHAAPEIPVQEIAQPTPEVIPLATGLRVVEVDNLLPAGAPEDMGVPGLYNGERNEDGPELRTQPRIDWVVSALQGKDFEIADMTLYRDKKVLGADPDKKPYVVLEVLKENHHFQIAICEIVGNATYIIKNPIDFQKDTKVTVADLKKMPTVFQTYCYAQDQWLQSTLNYAFTPLEELKEQLKTRIGWGDKKDAVENSFGLFYLETGQTPFTTDKSIIEYGPLAGKATWKRLYNALRRGDGAIPGLQHIKTFAQLRDHIFPEGIESPVLEFDAREVFKNAVLCVKETGKIPDLGEAFDRSLGAKKVSGLEDVVVGSADNVRSGKDFLAATGVAVQADDGALQPSSPVVIGQLERFANTLPKQQPT